MPGTAAVLTKNSYPRLNSRQHYTVCMRATRCAIAAGAYASAPIVDFEMPSISPVLHHGQQEVF